MDWSNFLNGSRLRKSERDTINDPRNEFESDFGRVIFSPAIRRMHDKTQVFPLTTDDNIHSRLTHSMEVMAIGHSLGLKLCESKDFREKANETEFQLLREIPVLLKNACLVHDIGNPPFGHFGETVIQDFFKEYFSGRGKGTGLKLSDFEKQDFEKFDGNAQGFRVLTKLQVLDDPYGLNLTLGTLGTYLKYPNAGIVNKALLSQKKRGVFQSERTYLELIAEGCDLKREGIIIRHPLAFLMEAADSICYLVMDLEDGFNKGWYQYSFIKEWLMSIEGMEEQFKKLEGKHIGYGADVARVVNLRIYLIKRFVDLAVNNFLSNIDSICNGDYNKELIADDETQIEDRLRKFCEKNIFPQREIYSLEVTGHSVLT